ncbi:MAG: adenylyltransferase/cytidyltransferase family protein [Candidatus Dojkabacteria bacterium]
MGKTKNKTKFNWNKRLVEQADLSELADGLRAKAKSIVFTAGAWDMLHVGQVRYLQQAKDLADVLVVGVSSNTAIRKVKGKNRPILDEMIRAEMVANLKSVDFVTIIPSPSCQPELKLLQPDVYISVKEDWNKDYKESKEYKTVKKYGGKVKLVDRQSPYISTTKILERAVSAQLGDIFKDLNNLRKDPLRER